MKKGLAISLISLLAVVAIALGILYYTNNEEKSLQIASLNSDVAEKAKQIETLQADTASKAAEIEALNADAASKVEQIKALDDDVAGKAEQIEMLQADVDGKATQIEVFQADVAGKAAQIEALQTDVDTKAGQIEALNKDVAGKAAQIDALNKDVADKAEQIDVLTKDIAGKSVQIETLQTSIADKAHQIETLEVDVARKAEKIEALQSDNAGKSAEIESLQTDVSDKATQIKALQVDVNGKATQIDTLFVENAEKSAQVLSLIEDNNEKKAQIAALAVENTKKDGIIETLNAELSEKGSQIEELNMDVEDKITFIEALKADITTISKQIDYLSFVVTTSDSDTIANQDYETNTELLLAELEEMTVADFIKTYMDQLGLSSEIKERLSNIPEFALNMLNKEDLKQLILNNPEAISPESFSLLSDDENILMLNEKVFKLISQVLSLKEDTKSANEILRDKAETLAAIQIELDRQQAEILSFQGMVNDQVNTRSKIIDELCLALNTLELPISLDTTTGDIVLRSDVLFDSNSTTMNNYGENLLSQFLPIYLDILMQPKYKNYVGEIIIEGHTDTAGSYNYNLRKSQDLALSLAEYCLQLPSLSHEQIRQLQNLLTVKGCSYLDPIYNTDGTIDMDASRRMVFTFRLKDI